MNKLTYLILIISFFISCQREDHDLIKELNDKGNQYCAENEFSTAREYYNKALSQRSIDNSWRATIYRSIGITYGSALMFDSTNTNLRDSAKYYFLRAAQIEEFNTYGYWGNMADIYLLNRNVDSAVIYLKRAWKIDSTKFLANNVLSVIYLGQYGDKYFQPSQALKYSLITYEKYNSRDTKSALAKNYFYLKKYKEAEKMYRELYFEHPNAGSFLYNLVCIMEKTGNINDFRSLSLELKLKFPEMHEKYLNEHGKF